MAEKKKKTILMDENSANVTPPSLASKVKSFAGEVIDKIHGVKGGLGVRTGPADFTVGVIKSTMPKDPLTGVRKGKSKLGAKVEFKF